MKIAIPTNDRETITQRTGRCKEFAIIETDNNIINYIINPHKHEHNDEHNHEHEHGHNHNDMIKLLIGIDLLAIKVIGKHLKNDLESANIEYLKVSQIKITDIIDAYKKGNLK